MAAQFINDSGFTLKIAGLELNANTTANTTQLDGRLRMGQWTMTVRQADDALIFSYQNVPTYYFFANGYFTANTVAGKLTAAAVISNTVYATTTDPITLASFDKATKYSAKFFVCANSATSYHTSEVMVLHNTTDVNMVEYGEINFNSKIYTLDAQINGSHVELVATPQEPNVTFNIKTLAN